MTAIYDVPHFATSTYQNEYLAQKPFDDLLSCRVNDTSLVSEILSSNPLLKVDHRLILKLVIHESITPLLIVSLGAVELEGGDVHSLLHSS
jgi:hypothetical protein